MSTAFITHPDCLKHNMGAGHPEQPARLTAIEDQLIASGVATYLQRYQAPLATDEQLARVHPIEYVRAIREAAPRSGTVHLDPDTAMNPHSLSAALRGAGSAVLAVDLIFQNKVQNAFCSVRPPRARARAVLARSSVSALVFRQERKARVSQAADHQAAAMLSEARGLLLSGWSRGAQARDRTGVVVPAWSEDAYSWSLLGALLASWHRQNGETDDVDFVAHGFDARALGEATQALGDVTGTASIDRWNDDAQRTLAEVVATIDRAVELVDHP